MSLHQHPALCTHPEQQYLDLLRELLDAPERATRNDTATRSLFGRQIRFDLAQGFPLLTTKRVFWKGVVAELLWMLSGNTNVKSLQAQGVHIWDEWADQNGDLGPVYGKQWRHWEGKPILESFTTERGDAATGTITFGIDQIATVLDSLRKDPYGRRHIVSAWNPADLPDMALPPCHAMFQFYVGADERLSLQLYQRSADIFLGVPFNIASYALLLSMFAAVLDRQPGEFIHTFGDVHLYGNHVDQAREQVGRQPRPFPRLRILQRDNMNTWLAAHVRIDGYDPWPAIKGEVSK